MKEFTYNVGHETMLNNGICYWQGVNTLKQFKQYYGPIRSLNDNYNHIIHYVRNPHDSLPSIMIENKHEESYKFRRDIIMHHYNIDMNDYNDYEAAIISYIYWNLLAEGQGPNIRIKVEESPEQLAKYLNVDVPKGIPHTSLNSNGSKKKEFDYSKINKELYNKLNKIALRYNYPTITESILKN